MFVFLLEHLSSRQVIRELIVTPNILPQDLETKGIRIVSAPDKELFEHAQTLLSRKLVRHDKGDTKDEKRDIDMQMRGRYNLRYISFL